MPRTTQNETADEGQPHGAEAKLRRSLAEHEAILRTAMDGFWVIGHDGRILEVNDAYCRLSGYTREELLGMTVLDLDANVSLASVASAIVQLRETGSGRFERLHRTKGGQVIQVELSVNFLPGDPSRIFCFIRDITQRRHSDERLRLLSATLEAAANAIVITDREGIVQWANPAFTSLTGYTLGEAMGRSPRDLISSTGRCGRQSSPGRSGAARSPTATRTAGGIRRR
jgi:PAS domain S-box-containing protein